MDEWTEAAQEAEAQGIVAAAGALLTLASGLRGISDPRQMGRQVARLLPAIFGVERCALVLSGPWAIDAVETITGSLETQPGAVFAPHRLAACQRAIQEQRRTVVLTSADDGADGGASSLLVIPFLSGDELLGFWAVEFPSGARQPDVRQVALADAMTRQVALALEDVTVTEREREAARLQGAIETARGLAHELSHPLSIVTGEAEILQRLAAPTTPIGEMSAHLGLLLEAARHLAERIRRVQRIVRLETRHAPGVGPYIDVDRSCSTDWIVLEPGPAPAETSSRGS